MKAKLLLAIIAILWIGMILAVGMESIVKFDTPTLTRAVAFDEGRYVFQFFNKIQFIFLAMMLLLVVNRDMSRIEQLAFLCVGATLLIQVFWLFPILSQHVDLILLGIVPPKTMGHALYGWLEITKVMLLAIPAFRLVLEFGKL